LLGFETVVDERKMMNHLYMLDTQSFVWTLIVGNGEGEENTSPFPRYFHSIEVWRDNLVLFGEYSHLFLISMYSC